MMKQLSVAAMIIGTLLWGGCVSNYTVIGLGDPMLKGSGVLSTETRSVPEFSAIDLDGAYEVAIRCGREQEVTVSGDDNIVPHIITEVQEAVLRVRLNQSISTKNKIILAIAIKNIARIHVSGASHIDVSGVDNKALDINVSGAAKLNVQGKSDALHVELSGVGNMDAQDLMAGKAVVRISGTGKAVLSVADELDASVSGVGDIEYHGNPEKVVKNISGIGSIRKR